MEISNWFKGFEKGLARLCECSRQSVIYSLHSLWKDKTFTVTLCHSILGGATDCEMRIEIFQKTLDSSLRSCFNFAPASKTSYDNG